MSVSLVRHADVFSFAERAMPWLLRSETEHNLILGIIEQLKANRGSNAYLATIEQAGEVAGCAFRTPPYKLGLTRMPEAGITALVEDVAQVYDELPAVLGPPAEARAFAEAWARAKQTRMRLDMHHRIYELRSVVFPAVMPSGELRPARERDLETVVGWLEQFAMETKVGTPNVAALVARHISHRTLFLWEDEGEPRTSALHAAQTPHGVRIGFVYTPAQFRGRGYASACTAMVSQRALESGNDFCCLYADLANPTSNAIYQRIGYRPVCDAVDFVFERESPERNSR